MLRSNRLRPWLTAVLPDGENEPPGGGGGAPPAPKTFTEEELAAQKTRAKDEARRGALQEAADRLGCTIDEAAEILKQHREQQDAAKTEAQRAKDEADRQKAEAENEKKDAAAEKHRTRTERLLIRAGVDVSDDKTAAANVDDAIALLGSVAADASDDDVNEAIGKLKARRPELFKAAAPGTRTTPNSDPGNPPRTTPNGKSVLELGMEEGRELFGVASDKKQTVA